MRILKTSLVVVALALCTATPATGLDVDSAPIYGTVNLQSGFMPDPYEVQLDAGGATDARSALSGCVGNITSRPSVTVNYLASEMPLQFSVSSETDTTLLVRTPDGRFLCNDDDSDGGLNPLVRVGEPVTGQYQVWVGNFAQGGEQEARLRISEVSSGRPSAISQLWPVPLPTADVVISRSHFVTDAVTQPSQARVNEILLHALRSAGYRNHWSYYAAPNGFTLVVEAESIRQDNARPRDPRFGFMSDQSLVNRLAGFVGAPAGHYRQILFVVSDQNWRAAPSAPPLRPMTQPQAESLFDEGAPQLPDFYASRQFTSRHTVTALIYEFDKVADLSARPRAYGEPRNSPRAHLRAAGLSVFAP